MKRALEALGSGVVVYVVMAACSGGAGMSPGGPGENVADAATESAAGASLGSGGVMGAGGSGGSPAGRDSGLADAVADAVADVVDPVPDAMAQDGGGGSAAGPEWETFTVECDKSYRHSNVTWHYAELELPGATQSVLARVSAIVPTVAPTARPPEYEHIVSHTYVRDGAVAVQCESDSLAVVFFVPTM